MRLCDNPAPSSGGQHCGGHLKEARPCGEVECRSAIEIPTDCGIRKGGNFRVVGGKIIFEEISELFVFQASQQSSIPIPGSLHWDTPARIAWVSSICAGEL